MTEGITVEYHEATESVGVERVPFAHLSIETGHLYLRELADSKLIRSQFAAVVPRVGTAIAEARTRYGKDARVSTCIMIDDYNVDPSAVLPSPAHVVALVAEAAQDTGLHIDYLARESGCVTASSVFYPDSRARVPLAEIVLGLITPEPVEGANGAGNPPLQSGWLSNGMRSDDAGAAMDAVDWQPPEEYGKRGHSVFIDVELYNEHMVAPPDTGGARRVERAWSCPMLAAVWHLLRLGMLRDDGRQVAAPCPVSSVSELPRRWEELPTVLKLNTNSAAFSAYEALSILPNSVFPAEVAADIVMNHISWSNEAFDLAAEAAAGEPCPLTLDPDCTKRICREFIRDF